MSRHDIYRQAVMTTGEPYTPRPADFGLCGRITCSRCGRLMRDQIEHEVDKLVKGWV